MLATRVRMCSYRRGNTILLGELPIGSIVYDDTWVWEFRTGNSYTGNGEIKTVEWIIIGNDHYTNDEVVLLSSELIGRYKFDDKYNSVAGGSFGISDYALSHINTWLNGTFYNALSNNFKNIILNTEIPNRTYNGTWKHTNHDIFLLSTVELNTPTAPVIGETFNYFDSFSKRQASLGGVGIAYWTRSPVSTTNYQSRTINASGGLNYDNCNRASNGIRPCLCVNKDTVVEIDEFGKYKIIH